MQIERTESIVRRRHADRVDVKGQQRYMNRKRVVVSLLALSLAAAPLVGCSGDDSTSPAAEAGEQSNAQTGQEYSPRSGDGVDVVYFETERPCECMAEVGDSVERAVQTHFQDELQSGALRFFMVVSDDPANEEIVSMFNSQAFDLFVVQYEDGKGTATPVYEIWTLMGDDEAIVLFTKSLIEKSLAEQNS